MKRGAYAEYICRCRKGCGYEKYDKNHPMWFCASAFMPTSSRQKATPNEQR